MTDNNARDQARIQLAAIQDMMERHCAALEADEAASDEILEEIYNDPLDVSVRTGWVNPNTEIFEPIEFRILLCTGGPAVQIVGDLDGQGVVYGTPSLEYQDWFTQWQILPLDEKEAYAVHEYCTMFFPA